MIMHFSGLSVEIRNPNKTHIPQVLELWEACGFANMSGERLSRLLYYDEAYDPNQVWMAREGGKVLGFLASVQHSGQAWIKALIVDPAARRRGIARDLLSRAEYRLSGEGAKQARVEGTPPLEFFAGVEPGSAAAALFEACGYQAGQAAQEQWLPAIEASLAPPGLDLGAALAFAREAAGPQYPWAEEQLACRPPRAVFDPAAGLCLFEPGAYVGPLWPLPGSQASGLQALARAAQSAASLGAERLRYWQVPGSAAWPLEGLRSEARLSYFKAL